MSSNLSSTLSSALLSSSLLPSNVLSSSILSSESSAPSSDPLRSFPPPSPSVPPPPSPTEAPSFSSPLPSSQSSFSSVISSKEPFAAALSANSTTSSSTSPGTTLSKSTSAVPTNPNTLRPVEITAIVLGVITAVLGVAAVLFFFCSRRKRHSHRPLYFAKEHKDSNESSRTDAEGRLYFHSLYEQKGTTPLLQNSAPNNSDLPHDEPYKDTELNHVLFPGGAGPRSPPLSMTMQNMVSTRPPRGPPPPQSPRPLLSLTIPEFITPSTIHSLMTSTQGSDAASRADADEGGDMDGDGDSPSVYSQRSTNLLSRGPSISSHVSVHRFSLPPMVLESIMAGESPTEENVRYRIEAGSEDGRTNSDETITSGTPGPVPFRLHAPESQERQHSQLNRDSELYRQNTTALASLLKSRHRQSELLPTAHSDVSHIERAGSIRTAHGITAGAGVGRTSGGDNGMDGREPYGRRFRRMKAEQENSGMATLT